MKPVAKAVPRPQAATTHHGLNGSNGNRPIDASFTPNKALTVHRWVPWIAGYSAHFVEDILAAKAELLTGPNVKVLDPFAGVGTTLLQAQVKGFQSAGFEINPYAWLACKVKLDAVNIDTDALNRLATRFESYMARNHEPESRPPEQFHTNIRFLSGKVERKVRQTVDFLHGVGDPHQRNVLKLAIGGTLVGVSNYSYEPSLASRPAAGKALIRNADVASKVIEKLKQISEDVESIRDLAPDPPPASIHLASFFDYGKHEAEGGFKLIITSPPYLNNYHYVRNTRPQLWWLGFVHTAQEMKALERANMGQYWQTVRDKPQIELEFEHAGIERVLKKLRNKRVKLRSSRGRGWANYVANYFNDSRRALQLQKRALAPGGEAVTVIGNSILQGVPIGVPEILRDLAFQCGFAQAELRTVRVKRVGTSIVSSKVRRGLTRRVLSESALHLRT